MSPPDGGGSGNAFSDSNRDVRQSRTPSALPDAYDNLAAVRRDAFALLSRGVADRRSSFHTPVLASHGVDEFPAARTVVLRGFDPENRTLSFHSDARSAKITDLVADDRAAALFYGPREKIQIRLTGRCRIHYLDDVAHLAWRRLPAFSRRSYAGAAPGMEIQDPSPEVAVDAPAPDGGVARFVVIRFRMLSLDWLYLSARGHRRARFDWSKGNGERAVWLTP